MHVLGTPPAFVLSQDQTLKKLYLKHSRASNHFLNHLLLAINSRIFVGCFRLRFKQIHKFVKGVLFVFALFNLQGTVFRSVANFDILPQKKLFVKMFFHLFWGFSVVCGPSSRFLTPFIGQLAYYNAVGFICQALFLSFSIYFFHPPRRSNVHIWRTFPERNTQIFEGINASANWCLQVCFENVGKTL